MAKRITTHPLRKDRQRRAAELDGSRVPATCGHRHTENGKIACGKNRTS